MKLNKTRAFTLIEMILVMLIAGIVLALSLPHLTQSSARFELTQTVDDLVAMGRWAKMMAIEKESLYAIVFAKDRRSYYLTRVCAENLRDDADTCKPFVGIMGKVHKLAGDMDIVVAEDRIVFYSDGKVDPVTIQLTRAHQKITLCSTQRLGMITVVGDG